MMVDPVSYVTKIWLQFAAACPSGPRIITRGDIYYSVLIVIRGFNSQSNGYSSVRD